MHIALLATMPAYDNGLEHVLDTSKVASMGSGCWQQGAVSYLLEDQVSPVPGDISILRRALIISIISVAFHAVLW